MRVAVGAGKGREWAQDAPSRGLPRAAPDTFGSDIERVETRRRHEIAIIGRDRLRKPDRLER